MFRDVGTSNTRLKLLDDILTLIITSGDIIHLGQDLQEDILNFRPDINIFNQSVSTNARVSTTTSKRVLEKLEKISKGLDERIKQL